VRHDVIDNRLLQAVLAAEVIGDGRKVYAGGTGDPTGRDRVETLPSVENSGGVQQPLAATARILAKNVENRIKRFGYVEPPCYPVAGRL
jgi:hypothetical protein